MTPDLRPPPREWTPRPAGFAARRGWILLLAVPAGLLLLGWALVQFWLVPQLPATAVIKELKLSVPLRVLTRDGRLIGEFGAERREPLAYAGFPPLLVQAFLAAEDDRFFSHPGVDWQGLLRAAVSLARTGEKAQGGSTITMQLARNVFLSSERTFTRKAKEILLALQIEEDLSKEQILEIYLNKIFLGQRAYGVGAAAQAYFGKAVRALDLGEMAVLAGLPKAPSRDNPIASPERARERRDYVLRRLFELGRIDEPTYQAARAQPVQVRESRPAVEVDAHYVAEMVRAELVRRYGEQAYAEGYTVVTTVDAVQQEAANAALRDALRGYDERHGYRGPEASLPADALAELPAALNAPHPQINAALDALPAVAGVVPAVVLAYATGQMSVLLRDGSRAEIQKEGYAWAQFKEGSQPAAGDVVRVRRMKEGLALSQLPQVQGALVALDPRDGAVRALVGGYDFFAGKFNRVTQAQRQPGSGFKPFLYTAALAAGYTPASVILDAPVVFDDPALESSWRPENYTGKFYGPTRLREALVDSRNLVSIRLLQGMGIEHAREFATRFGFAAERLPRDLTLALGSLVLTPLEVARGYAVFANGGFLIEPYFIQEIRDSSGVAIFQAEPALACPDCPELSAEAPAAPAVEAATDAARSAPRVLEPRLVFLARDMMRDVATRGTAAKVGELGRNDLAGKTGTTNDETDAWFNGFQSGLAGVAWLGYDQPQPLGRGEVGGRAALPMWMDFMKVALQGVKEDWPERPAGLVSVRIDPTTGKLAQAGQPGAIFEIVQAEHLPTEDAADPQGPASEQQKPEDLY